jgi:hypothetical protein
MDPRVEQFEAERLAQETAEQIGWFVARQQAITKAVAVTVILGILGFLMYFFNQISL